MEDLFSTVFSGFSNAVGTLFGHPIDFLAGKSCSVVCGPTWDLFCYIENFCIANLLKLATVAFLFYIVLLFFYLSYKLGVCQCICGTLCSMIWAACFATCFWVCDYGCYCLCYMLRKIKRKGRHRRRDIEQLYLTTSEEEEEAAIAPYYHRPHRSKSRRWRDYKGDQLRRSLRPRSHRVRVGISGDSCHVRRKDRAKHGVESRTIHDLG